MASRAVLAIDTAGPVIGVAAVSELHPGLKWEQRVVRGADAVLLPAIARMLEAMDARGDALVGVAVVVGPGAFTGLRVGLAAALGIAVAREVPVFPEGSLEARARLCSHRPLLVLLDARKKRFYGQWFDTDGPQAQPVDKPIEEILETVPPGCVAVGEGAVVSADYLATQAVSVRDDAARVPVEELGRAALTGHIESMDAAAVQLKYVRPPDAKRPTHLLVPPDAPC